MPDGGELGTKHDGGEQGKEQALEHQEEEEYHGGRRRVGRTLVELGPHAGDAVVDGQEQGVERHHSNVKLKQGSLFSKQEG